MTPKPGAPQPTTGFSSIQRALSVIEELANNPKGMSVTNLAAGLGLSKSVVSRILTSLLNAGYVVHDSETRWYSLSFRPMSLMLKYADSLGFPDVCMPLVRALSRECGELVQLSVVEGDGMRYVAQADDGEQRIRVLSLIGREAPLHATASGRVWLASLPEDYAIHLALQQGLHKFTPRTITSIDALRRDLRQVRRDGYAINEEQFTLGANGIAAPIVLERRGNVVVGAVIVTGPSFRLTRERLLALAPRVVQAARELAEIWPKELDRHIDRRRAADAGKESLHDDAPGR